MVVAPLQEESTKSESPKSPVRAITEPRTHRDQMEAEQRLMSASPVAPIQQPTPVKPGKTKSKSIRFDARSLLLDYAKLGDMDGLKALLEPQAVPHGRNSSRRPSVVRMNVDFHHPSSGLTALHNACAYGNLEIVRFLVEEMKADVNVRDNEGWTIVHSCITEIPPAVPQETPRNKQNEQNRAQRRAFIQVLHYLLNDCPNLKLDATTWDEETIEDMIPEDETTGELDQEVYGMVSAAMQHYHAEHPASSSDDQENDEESEGECTTPTPTPRTLKRDGHMPLKGILKKQ